MLPQCHIEVLPETALTDMTFIRQIEAYEVYTVIRQVVTIE